MSRAVPLSALPAELRARIKKPRATRNKLVAEIRAAQARLRVESFLKMLDKAGLPAPLPEYVFHPSRKWRFDYAWPEHKIALEVEGAAWTNGRHTRGAGFVADMRKYSEAAVMGWCLIRVTPDALTSRHTEEMLRRAFRLRSKSDL